MLQTLFIGFLCHLPMLEELEKIRKPLYGISIVIGALGILLSWILVFISYSAIDSLGRALNEQVDSIADTLAKAEEAAASVANEIDATNQSLADLETSLNELDTALDDSGDAFIVFGTDLQLIDREIGSAFISAGDDLKTSATSTAVVADGLEQHGENLDDIKNKKAGIFIPDPQKMSVHIAKEIKWVRSQEKFLTNYLKELQSAPKS
jgi:chaperonin cofactor prefoldin